MFSIHDQRGREPASFYLFFVVVKYPRHKDLPATHCSSTPHGPRYHESRVSSPHSANQVAPWSYINIWQHIMIIDINHNKTPIDMLSIFTCCFLVMSIGSKRLNRRPALKWNEITVWRLQLKCWCFFFSLMNRSTANAYRNSHSSSC